MYSVSQERFEEMVNDALDSIPPNLAHEMRNVVVLVEDFNPDQPTLLGLYEGVALTRRPFDHTGLPDAITIYKEPLERISDSEETLNHEVYVTVLHEVGHYFGMSEAQLHRLGWG